MAPTYLNNTYDRVVVLLSDIRSTFQLPQWNAIYLFIQRFVFSEPRCTIYQWSPATRCGITGILTYLITITEASIPLHMMLYSIALTIFFWFGSVCLCTTCVHQHKAHHRAWKLVDKRQPHTAMTTRMDDKRGTLFDIANDVVFRPHISLYRMKRLMLRQTGPRKRGTKQNNIVTTLSKGWNQWCLPLCQSNHLIFG